MIIDFTGKKIEIIIEEYSDTLLRIAYNNTKNMSDAEDIVQDVFVKLMGQNKNFETSNHLKSWLIRVTINACKDYLKSSWFKKVVPLEPTMQFQSKKEQKIMDEIFKLKPMDRNLIYLHYYEGYKLSEIGAMLDMNPNTVNTRLRRARGKLKNWIEEGECAHGSL